MFWVWMPRTVRFSNRSTTSLQNRCCYISCLNRALSLHCILFSVFIKISFLFGKSDFDPKSRKREKTPIRYVWINEIWKRIYLLWSLNGLNRIINRFMTFIFDAMQHRFPFDFGFILRSLMFFPIFIIISDIYCEQSFSHLEIGGRSIRNDQITNYITIRDNFYSIFGYY